jgi:hypothetical protein
MLRTFSTHHCKAHEIVRRSHGVIFQRQCRGSLQDRRLKSNPRKVHVRVLLIPVKSRHYYGRRTLTCAYECPRI